MRSSLVALAILCPFLEAQDDRLDRGIANARGRPEVFVRMADQVLRKGPDYNAFCEKNKNARRGELRAKIVASLKNKSDASWAKIQKRVGAMEGVDAVKRYWIVNGFACRATAAACVELAKDDAVAFIYLRPARVPSLINRPGRVGVRVKHMLQNEAKTALAELKKAENEEFPPLEKLSPTWNLIKIKAVDAWKLGAMGQGVTVAMQDSGLLMTPALARALWKNPKEKLNGKDDDGNGYVDDLFGYDFSRSTGISVGEFRSTHGSMCGGILAGRPVSVNGKWIVTGVAPKARLMVLRGMGMFAAYEYAIDNGADITSMSFMWVRVLLGNWRGLYRLAHEHMTLAGIVSVGGSGNFATNAPRGKQICLPKDIPCVICASGLNANDRLPTFSSLGPCTWEGVKFYDDYPPDKPLRKPDVTTFSTGFPCWTRVGGRLRRGWTVTHDFGNGIGLVTGPAGNSFSGPHAGGVAALMLSANPDLPAWRVKEIMEATCRDLGKRGRDNKYGAGMVDALAAVKKARQ